MGHLARCHADTHWKVCPCQQQPDELPAPPLVELLEPGPTLHDQVIRQLMDQLAALTTTVVCHPDQVEALETAAADLRGCGPVRVMGNPAVPTGRAYVMEPGTQQLEVPR